MSGFARNQPEMDQNFVDEPPKMPSRDMVMRQDSGRFPMMDNMGLGGSGNNEMGQPRPYFSSNLRNFDGIGNEAFPPPTGSFKSNDIDLSDNGLNRNTQPSFTNNYSGYDFKFSSNNMMSGPNRMPQPSFNNPFVEPNRNPLFGQEYPNNVMNPNNQFPAPMGGPVNYYNYPHQRHNYFYKKYK